MASATTAQSVPSPWVSVDIGSPSPAGSASYDGQSFSIAASGADIWGSFDQFHFVYQQISGDVDVVARVDSVSQASIWSRAGVMIRASLSPGAAHGFALVSAGKGVVFQKRLTAGAASSNIYGENAAPPRWVRLVRAGTKLTAYSSVDGTVWATISSATIALGQTAYVGLATTSRNAGSLTHATISRVKVSSTSLPAGLSTRDIGSPAIVGTTAYKQGVYTISAGGIDIWKTTDQFRFVYQPITGDVDMKARVASIKQADQWSKAGVMVRESLDPGARNVMALLSAGRGYSFQWRLDPSGMSDYMGVGSGVAPGWIRLVRSGSRFEGFRSTNGTTWTSMGSETVPMAATVYVGLAVTSHNPSVSTTAVIDSVAMDQTSAPPNQKPTVTLTSPASASTYPAPATIPISATASDPENRMARVEFFANGTRVGTDSASPYAMSWTSVPAGTYSLTAVAYDTDGGSATSSPVTIVVGTNQLPTVSLTAPANGATFTAPATINMTATASDPENRLARVEFYVGSSLVATDTTSPFAATWSTSTAGTYLIKATAYDSNGGVKTSAVSTITVTATSVVPRNVEFTASSNHATSVTSYRLDIFSNGANPATATPVASSNLGKPTPNASGTIVVDRATFFSALAPATYVATVSAIGPTGQSRSSSITFKR